MTKLAALFVEPDGPYATNDFDCWPRERDARLYAGPYRAIAHPPCERWGRYWHGGPSAKVRKIKGDDAGCFEAALLAVNRWGGVLEHPEASHAWNAFGLTRPPKSGGWLRSGDGWTCCVEQGHYGHRARKATWIYAATSKRPDELIWGPASGERLDEGFHSAEERRRLRDTGRLPRPRLSRAENLLTPIAFRDTLVRIAVS
jgi:hypothetical protein